MEDISKEEVVGKKAKKYSDGVCMYCLEKKMVKGHMCKDCKAERVKNGFTIDLHRIMYANLWRLILTYQDKYRPIHSMKDWDAAIVEVAHLRYLRDKGIRLDSDPSLFNEAVITDYQNRIEELENENDELERENKIYEGENDEMKEELYTYRNEKELTELEEKLRAHSGDRVVLNKENIELLKPYLEYGINANLNYRQMMATKVTACRLIIGNYRMRKIKEEKKRWLEEKKQWLEEKKQLEEEKKQWLEEEQHTKKLFSKTISTDTKIIQEYLAGMTPDLPE